MIPGRPKKKKRVKLFVMNAKVLRKRKKPPSFSPWTRERVIKVVLIAAILLCCAFGGFEAGRHFLTDAGYAVKRISVRGNEVLSAEEIISLSLLKEGQNIFLARIYRAKKRLLTLPLMEQVRVSRVMPDGIMIDVVERRPQAMLSGRKKFLADFSGVLLPYSCCPQPEKLPLIVGVDTTDMSVGDKCDCPEMTKAMRVLALWQSSPLTNLSEVDGIDASRTDNLRLYLRQSDFTKRHSEFLIGGDGFELKLAKLATILRSVVQKHKKKVQGADLTQDFVPIQF